MCRSRLNDSLDDDAALKISGLMYGAMESCQDVSNNMLLVAILALCAAHIATRYFFVPYVWSANRHLPGPRRRSMWFGSMADVLDRPPGATLLEWHARYGSVLRFFGFAGDVRLSITDPLALSHILLKNAYSFHNGAGVMLADILGHGLILAEGANHKRQRRLINGAFAPKQLDKMSQVFTTVAQSLSTSIRERLPDGGAEVDIIPTLSKASLDILGLAAFDFDFGALSGRDQKLVTALEDGLAHSAGAKMTNAFAIANVLFYYLPVLKHIPAPAITAMRVSLSVTMDESQKVLSKKRLDVDERSDKDIISLLIKSADEDSLGLSDEEITAQMATFIVAGHETVATALTWCLYELAKQPHLQEDLLQEVLTAAGDMSALMDLPFLDAVVREILRLHPPVPALLRRAVKDVALPLSSPQETSAGSVDYINVKKGQLLYIPIAAIQCDEKLWGDDAAAFRPSRFLQEQSDELKSSTRYTLWSHLLAFGGGTRSCIGYKFAIMEMKAVLARMVVDFTFAPTSKTIISRVSPLIARPLVVGSEASGSQMPLKMTAR